MIHLKLDNHRPGTKEVSLPECHYSYILIVNNTAHHIRLYDSGGRGIENLIAESFPYTTISLPKPLNANSVFIDFTGAQVGERAHIYFLVDNPGLIGNFIQAAPAVVMDVNIANISTLTALRTRGIEWDTWSMSVESLGNTAITLTRPAESGRIHVITGFEALIFGASAALDIPTTLRLGATVVYKSVIGSGAVRGSRIGYMGSKIAAPAGVDVSIQAGAGGAGVITTLNLVGYSRGA